MQAVLQGLLAVLLAAQLRYSRLRRSAITAVRNSIGEAGGGGGET